MKVPISLHTVCSVKRISAYTTQVKVQIIFTGIIKKDIRIEHQSNNQEKLSALCSKDAYSTSAIKEYQKTKVLLVH